MEILYSIYQISSDLTDSTYIGYCEGDDFEHIKQTFLCGAKRNANDDVQRGSTSWLNFNHNQEDNIQIDILDAASEEAEALFLRNDHRSKDPHSITGPASWPANLARKVKESHPDCDNIWATRMKLRNCKTARQAMKLGGLLYEDVKQLGTYHPRNQIVHDLDDLLPAVFCQKYGLTLNIL